MAVLLETDGATLVDYLKVGPFQGAEAVGELALQYPLMLHLDDTLGGEPLASPVIQTIVDWAHLTGTPWTSEHIAYSVSFARLGNALDPWPRSALMSRDETLAHIVTNVRTLTAILDVPLLLENIPFFPSIAHIHVCEPAFLSEVIEATGCGLLLDLAHARVSASALGYDVFDYVSALPLDRVVELHLSGPRPKSEVSSRLRERLDRCIPTVTHLVDFDDANLVDVHEPMCSADYELLDWVLAHVQPKAISLEYYRDPAALRQQLERLNGILGRVPG